MCALSSASEQRAVARWGPELALFDRRPLQITPESGLRVAEELGLTFIESCGTRLPDATKPFEALASIVLANYEQHLSKTAAELTGRR